MLLADAEYDIDIIGGKSPKRTDLFVKNRIFPTTSSDSPVTTKKPCKFLSNRLVFAHRELVILD